MLRYAICAFLAPALASAAAFPWSLPEPTFVIPEADNWSPAPTRAPNVGALELFKRDVQETICGYMSGISASEVTCNASGYVCATNTYYGVHGCCDPNDMSACSIPTTCVPSSLMSKSCTDDQCTSNGFIAKCTGTDAPECYEWQFIYSTPKPTTLTEYGCAATGVTAVIERTFGGQSASSLASELQGSGSASTTSTTSPTASASPTALQATQNNSKSSSTGAIVGGVVGGLVVLGLVISFIVWLVLRDRRHKREAATHQSWPTPNESGPAPGVTEYNPHGFIAGGGVGSIYDESQHKAFGAKGVHSPSSPYMSNCSPGDFGNERGQHGHGATLFGVVETAGTPLYEAPAK